MKNENILEKNSQSILDPLVSNILALKNNPYKNYNDLNQVWNNPSHGININHQDKLNLFLNDIDKSETIWKETGVYLGLVFQAVENNTVVDIGVPIGLVSKPEKIDDYNYDELTIKNDFIDSDHIKRHQILEFIELYKEYLIDKVVKNLDSIQIEIKPFYAISNKKINYQIVERDYFKKNKIK